LQYGVRQKQNSNAGLATKILEFGQIEKNCFEDSHASITSARQIWFRIEINIREISVTSRTNFQPQNTRTTRKFPDADFRVFHVFRGLIILLQERDSLNSRGKGGTRTRA